ncbi:hypothetical protein NQ318_007401 [Aromia moschata]|uniref:Uncharacterized protein n=1 Tax=Aromia moschata TaxID=1265417 RepID=A0AAV8YFD9_9CUCU|nr:hypothetical protein NQ318_007401 [Aromia moschata]
MDNPRISISNLSQQFHLLGYVNSQSMRLWSADNPYFRIETPLHPQKIGVWAAANRRRVVRLVVLT